MTTVLVCGSRSWLDYRRVFDRLAELQPRVVIEGDAPGADRCARNAAYALEVHCATVPALWERFGKRAGPARNRAMLALRPDLVLAFWNGSSRGTAHMIEAAHELGLPVEVVRS